MFLPILSLAVIQIIARDQQTRASASSGPDEPDLNRLKISENGPMITTKISDYEGTAGFIFMIPD